MTCFTSATTSSVLRTALISLLAACAGDHRCVDEERTIESGVYGEVVYRTLDGGDTPLYQVEMTLMQQGSQAKTETNADGIYEFAVPTTMEVPPPFFTVASTTFPNANPQEETVTTITRVDLVIEEGQVFFDDKNFAACP